MSRSLLPKQVIPEALRVRAGEEAIQADPKLQRMIVEIQSALEQSVRWFLQEHCGVAKARDPETPIEDIRRAMKIGLIQVAHVRVIKRPELTGIWIIQGDKPLVSFPDRKMKNGKLLPQMMTKLNDDSIQVVSSLVGTA